MSAFHDMERQDGVRLSWNVWPHSRLGAAKCVVPFTATYAPNAPLENMPVVPYEPIHCKTCGAVLNAYCSVDFNSKLWICPFCHARNHFPPHYQAISETNLPAELFPNYTTIEYGLNATLPQGRPTYVFVVDTAVTLEKELDACKAAILQAVQRLPETCQVGLITFGTHVHVHELGYVECTKSYVFKGSKTYTPEQVAEYLGLGNRAVPMTRGGPSGVHSNGNLPAVKQQGFIVPLAQCEFQISEILDELQKDPFVPIGDHRPARCTGTAVQVAAGMMRACLTLSACTTRMILISAGPSTEGPGMIVGKELAEAIRSHKDLRQDTTTHFRKAVKYYSSLADQMVHQGHCFDLFVCSLEQIGLTEMKELVERTGGLLVQTDSFTNPIFKESLKRMFDGHSLGISSNAMLEVIPSRDIRICGIIGPAASLEKKTAHVSDTSIGVGGTSLWRLCGLDPRTNLTIVFDITSAAGSKDYSSGTDQFNLQFITRYVNSKGEHRCRVSTVARHWTYDDNLNDLISGFDQEAACVSMARIAGYKMEFEEEFDATRWLDRSLIRLSSRFGEYRKDDPQSFSLRQEMEFYPQFMFNLRRSQFVQVFGNSPDESTFFRIMLNRVSVPEAMVMIQPSLTSYAFQSPPEPALLDVQSIEPDRILLLDAYFYIVVFHGSTVAQWRKAGYHEQEEHKAFAEMLKAPAETAKEICKNRFPFPRFVDCDQNGRGQSRFLLARLNPSSTYTSTQAMSSEVLMTDDVSLTVFSEHLKKLAVQS